MSHYPLYLILSLAFILQSCSEVHFFGLAPKARGRGGSSPAPEQPVAEPSPPNSPADPSGSPKPDEPTPEAAHPAAKAGLALVFVVELPRRPDPTQAPEQFPVSAEPQHDADAVRCLSAAEARTVLGNMPDHVPEADIQIGLIPFSGRALMEDMLPPVAFSDFVARADAGNFCVRVAANHP